MPLQENNKNNQTLFRKILLSFFSKKSMTQAGLNPAAIFISFISAKQFFWLINRRIVEHYKLNMFDITIDPFEVKIGFGESPTVNIKELDFYYSYNSAANFIWYRFYSPNNIATGLSIIAAISSHHILSSKYPTYFRHFIFTIYIFVFVIIGRIKTIPEWDLQTRYDWFMKTFWNLYVLIFEKTRTKLNTKTLLEIQTMISSDVRLWFCLYRIIEYISNYFNPVDNDTTSYYKWLFMDELKDKNRSIITDNFINNHITDTIESTFSETDKAIVELLIPADISIKYLFGDKEWWAITRYVLDGIYNKDYLDEIMDSFIRNWERSQEFLDYIISPEQFKKNFFFWIQDYIRHLITNHKDLNNGNNDTTFSSLINDEDINTEHIPEAIKIETNILDRLINFYIGYIWWLQIARADTGYIRLAKPKLLNQIMNEIKFVYTKPDTLEYYTKLFLLYSKNLFYYKYAHDHIRSGKDSFNLPIKWTINIQESNLFLMKMLSENVIINILQDINKDNTRLSVKTGDIILLFKDTFSQKISSSIALDNKSFIEYVYGPYDRLLQKEGSISTLIFLNLQDEDISLIKDRMYNLDFRLAHETSSFIAQNETILTAYDTMVCFSILGVMRETFFWFLISLSHAQTLSEAHQKNYHTDLIIYLYCRDILNIDTKIIPSMSLWITEILTTYQELLSLRTHLDDNQNYMYIGFNNRVSRSQDKIDIILTSDLPREDTIRRLGYLKNITYYNKRYLIPEI
jgi:hypothetical protein